MNRLVVVLLLALAIAIASGATAAWSELKDVLQCEHKRSLPPRPHSITITEFGAVGDGVTLNTVPFQNAVFYAKSFADKGGAQLYVPKGRWLTGSFNLTSHLTLFLEREAVILSSKDIFNWPVVAPLPSYGEGTAQSGGRHCSLLNGNNLTDVVITGNNGVIDGQGSVWWDQFISGKMNFSRPHLVEFTDSQDILVSNLTLVNSPAWGIHPVYCSNVRVENVTVQTPTDSPWTNGIVPDSSSDVCITHCIVSVSNDAITLKSGWDGYGISYGRPSSGIHISHVNLRGFSGSGLALGSEMSGGISQVHADHLTISGSRAGILLKTAVGRGGYVEQVVVSDVVLADVAVGIEFTGNWSVHPNGTFDPAALPAVDRITVKNVVGSNVSVPGTLSGIDGDPFLAICMSNLSISSATATSGCWSCSNVVGYATSVIPQTCSNLNTPSLNSSDCYEFDTGYDQLVAA